MLKAFVKDIEYHLPETVLTNDQLAKEFVDWSVDKIYEKTGIASRHISGPSECSSDLACAAAESLFDRGACTKQDIDFLIFCTQSPDYFLPSTSCIIQDRLGLPKTIGSFDYNLGCSGYVQGLSLAKGLIESGQAFSVLLLTGETYSKFIHPEDRSVRTIFGDAGTATLVQGQETESGHDLIGPFVFGTDGRGAKNLIVPIGGMRRPHGPDKAPVIDDGKGNRRTEENLFMNGPEIYTFTLAQVPKAFSALLDKGGVSLDQVDKVVFHQANEFMLEKLRAKCAVPEERFVKFFREVGNTVSGTIPIALKAEMDAGRLKHGQLIALVAFGVGYSWNGTLLRWSV